MDPRVWFRSPLPTHRCTPNEHRMSVARQPRSQPLPQCSSGVAESVPTTESSRDNAGSPVLPYENPHVIWERQQKRKRYHRSGRGTCEFVRSVIGSRLHVSVQCVQCPAYSVCVVSSCDRVRVFARSHRTHLHALQRFFSHKNYNRDKHHREHQERAVVDRVDVPPAAD